MEFEYLAQHLLACQVTVVEVSVVIWIERGEKGGGGAGGGGAGGKGRGGREVGGGGRRGGGWRKRDSKVRGSF